MNYIDKLIEKCKTAKSEKPVKEFFLKDISELDGIEQAIYIIEQTSGDIEDTFLDFSLYKDKNERKCAKLNSPSKTMYVGSSTTGIRKRIEQHYGNGNKGTYALHLKHWFNGEYQIKIMVYNVEKAVIQIIEDNISDKLNPAFGKLGGNNK